MDDGYTLYALRYATRTARHADHFAGEVPDPDRPMPMDYFVWLAVSGERRVLIDTGFNRDVGVRRGRTYLGHPAEMLRKLGVNPGALEDVVLTHLHYDHAGTIDSFPNARLHLQERELEFATGRGNESTRRAFEAADIANVVQAMYAKRTVLHDGSANPWPGIELHLVGGHTPGSQIVRVRTARGWVVLAADASHFYENMDSARCFHGTHDVERNKASFTLIRELADSPQHVIPGHDPQVMVRYPPISSDSGIAGVRLDCPPLELPGKGARRMRGMTFGGDRTIEFIQIADPVPGPGDVVIEIKASGICGTDLHLYRGPKGQSLLGATSSGPVIRGHEPCGIVTAVGTAVPEHQAKIGDRVMVHHYWGCAACRHCRTGWPQMCERQRPVVYGSGAGHGGHAPYMKVPSGTIVPLPDELSFSAGAAIACGTGTAYAALRRLGVRGGDSIAIFGQGPVGLAATQLAVAMGARVIALDLSQERLMLARDMGAEATLDSSATDPVGAIQELTGGQGADLAMDASGAADARHAALDSLRPWGTLALVGVGGTFSPNVGRYMQRQQTVFGAFTFSTVGQADCADFAVRRNVAIDRIFSDTWHLDEADAAYRKTDAQVAGKGVFLF